MNHKPNPMTEIAGAASEVKLSFPEGAGDKATVVLTVDPTKITNLNYG